jgi:hypothetical protein
MGILGVKWIFHSWNGRFRAQMAKKGVQVARRRLKWRDEGKMRARERSNEKTDDANRLTTAQMDWRRLKWIGDGSNELTTAEMDWRRPK